jgi:hypothetical protein
VASAEFERLVDLALSVVTVRIGPRERAAHEPIISSVIVAEVPLAGLSFFIL